MKKLIFALLLGISFSASAQYVPVTQKTQFNANTAFNDSVFIYPYTLYNNGGGILFVDTVGVDSGRIYRGTISTVVGNTLEVIGDSLALEGVDTVSLVNFYNDSLFTKGEIGDVTTIHRLATKFALDTLPDTSFSLTVGGDARIQGRSHSDSILTQRAVIGGSPELFSELSIQSTDTAIYAVGSIYGAYINGGQNAILGQTILDANTSTPVAEQDLHIIGDTIRFEINGIGDGNILRVTTDGDAYIDSLSAEDISGLNTDSTWFLSGNIIQNYNQSDVLVDSSSLTLNTSIFSQGEPYALPVDATGVDCSTTGSYVITQANTGATNLTTAANCPVGTVLTIVGGSSTNSTVVVDSGSGTDFHLEGGANFTLGEFDVIVLQKINGTDWVEKSRSNN